jgi:hypothetical protein
LGYDFNLEGRDARVNPARFEAAREIELEIDG